MFILTMIRKNLPGKPDYIMTAKNSNDVAIAFKTEADAMSYYRNTYAGSTTFPVYSPCVIYAAEFPS